MFGGQAMSSSPEDVNKYGAGFGNQGLAHPRQHAPRYPTTPPCGPQDVTQGQGEYNNPGHHFHSQSPSYRPRGHTRIAPWMRPPPRFVHPNVNGYTDVYSSRGFHGNHRGGGSFPRMRDSQHYGQHYGSYRNGRRYGRMSHLPNQNYSVPINCYPNHHSVPQHEEYVPFPYSPNVHNQSYSPGNLEYLPQGTQPCTPGAAYLPFPLSNNVYVSPENLVALETGDKDKPADEESHSEGTQYRSEHLASAVADPLVDITNSCSVEGSSNDAGSVPQPRSPRALAVTTARRKTKRRSSSTDSSEDGSGSLCLTSESSSDGFDNEDSGVSTFEPSEDEKLRSIENSLSGGNLAEEFACQGEEPEIPCDFLLDDQDFTLVWIEAKSAHVTDGKGNTSSDETSCYAVWFGPRSQKNIVDEVCGKYNQERGKTGYILGVIRALSTIKEAGNSHKVHLVMGSSFVMNNLSSWMKNLKNQNMVSSNWTEWKHMREIIELIEVADGMILKFSLAHPRDEMFVQCREAVASRWEEMRRRRIEASTNLSHLAWPVSSATTDED